MTKYFLHIKLSNLFINTFELEKINSKWEIPLPLLEYLESKSISEIEIFEIRIEKKILFYKYYTKVGGFISNKLLLDKILNKEMVIIERDTKIQHVLS